MKHRLVLLVSLAVPCAHAQFSSAVQGTVLDPSLAAVPSAKLKLNNAQTGIGAETVSNSAGFYRFSSLAPGNYELKVEAPGFRAANLAVALTTGQTRDINLNLEVQTGGRAD